MSVLNKLLVAPRRGLGAQLAFFETLDHNFQLCAIFPHISVYHLQKFVEGYVRERRRYLKRRVEAQREGHGGFHRAGTKSSAGGVSRGSGQQCKAAEASKAEFKVRARASNLQ